MPHIVEFPKCAVCNESADIRQCPVCDDFVCREFIHISTSMGGDNMDVDTTCDHEHDVLTGAGWIVPEHDAGAAVSPEGMSWVRGSEPRGSASGDSAGRHRDGAPAAVSGAIGPIHGLDPEYRWLAAFQDVCNQLDLLVEQLPITGRDLEVQRALSTGVAFLRTAANNILGTNRDLAANWLRPKTEGDER